MVDNGYILTNFHVVEDATQIQLKFNGDPAEYNAKLVGSDPETDLAVIKIEDGKKSSCPRKSATRTACRWATGPSPSAPRSDSKPR